jgi:Asp-tRNA(Asn)/Glu-tRNA(Gln) amidotransferase C subunit
MTKEVDSILGYVGQIQNSTGDAERIVPTHRNVMRDDAVTHEPREYTEKLLKNAPAREGDYLKVKNIL